MGGTFTTFVKGVLLQCGNYHICGSYCNIRGLYRGVSSPRAEEILHLEPPPPPQKKKKKKKKKVSGAYVGERLQEYDFLQINSGGGGGEDDNIEL